MQNSKCIISINHTAGVPIFDISHYGAVADYRSLVPAIIEEIREEKVKHPYNFIKKELIKNERT